MADEKKVRKKETKDIKEKSCEQSCKFLRDSFENIAMDYTGDTESAHPREIDLRFRGNSSLNIAKNMSGCT